ncbi:PREDICTED: ubiquinone biosynthesis O-methyltransferase, mitochondrial [Dufourea novaeangliae]|uniref:Ubiquinone biosynthesis O-methyltransferase, mitochondrial n=1 Tax=Dufourea novaeangliae TaxID=178035 RepID=A0A154PHV5_DUFNO|nr:PREDICTED: ubiquinone biosynthesis O-methyltransferase, mitochondrial [Dufourea novaeangliae]KZC11377.1 Hexaprenyldihydroxybenzoate methyltransferase, mitochondrial [Dufourea novaeangliae]
MKILKFLPSRSISTGNPFRNRLTEQVEHSTKSSIVKKSTVDVTTVEHHSKLSNQWWDVNGELCALHSLNPLRVQFVRDGLANTGMQVETPYLPLEGTKILDVGCGGGLLSEPLARIGAEVTGIDASSELIKTAKQHASLDLNLDGRLNYVQAVMEDYYAKNKERYDAVVASEVLEHVNNKELFLKYCVDTLIPGGSIFLTTLNKTLPSWLGGIIAAEHVLKLVPTGTHDWNKFITPAEIQRLLETCGCKTKLIHGMFYNPLKNEWFWTSSTAINYAVHAVKKRE